MYTLLKFVTVKSQNIMCYVLLKLCVMYYSKYYASVHKIFL